jgi:anionic cell wall polymer biosynthesis LytR-Cps2A-Psr (LCP) family protein
VLEPIYDPYYPGPNNSYEVFQIAGGEQYLSGDVALKYARSRQTTSDFSRTLRQQQIIKGVIKQIV